MSRNWTREELVEKLKQNPGLRIALDPLERAPTETRKPPNGNAETPGISPEPSPEPSPKAPPKTPPKTTRLTARFPQGGPPPRPAAAPAAPRPTKAEGWQPPVDWLEVLMRVPSWRARLDPEEALSVAVATELRKLSLAGELQCAWSRIPGEHEQGGRLGAMHQVKRAIMGHVPGVPDFGFWWGSGSGVIELKVQQAQLSLVSPTGFGFRAGRKTYQTPRQRLWQHWAQSFGARHAVVRSVEELRTTLQAWGLLAANE